MMNYFPSILKIFKGIVNLKHFKNLKTGKIIRNKLVGSNIIPLLHGKVLQEKSVRYRHCSSFSELLSPPLRCFASCCTGIHESQQEGRFFMSKLQEREGSPVWKSLLRTSCTLAAATLMQHFKANIL